MFAAHPVPLKVAKEFPAEELCFYPKEQKHWIDSAAGEKPIYYSKQGSSSQAEFPATTMCAILIDAAKKHPNHFALVQEDPSMVEGKQTPPPPAVPIEQCRVWTWSKYHEDVRKLARAMRAVGFVQFDTCSIFGFNSPEWVISSMAGMFAGGKSNGIYPTDTPEQFEYKLKHSKTSVLFVESMQQVKLVSESMSRLPYVKAIVVWGETPEISTLEHCSVWGWDAFLAESSKTSDEQLDAIVSQVKPGNCSTLIYTSGTTGQPKAVMCAHDSEVFVARNAVLFGGVEHVADTYDSQERIVSYLPLSHIAGKLLDVIIPLVITSMRPGYCTTYFARRYDMKLGTLVDRLKWAKPTIFLGVPRVYEKISEKLRAVGATMTGFTKTVSMWAKSLAAEHQANMQLGGTGKKPWLYWLAERLVLSKIKSALGLDEVKYVLSGAAPLQLDTLQFFGSLGININEVLGMSESTGVVTWSSDTCHIWGTAGYTLPGMDVRIKRFGDGEECPRVQTLQAQIPEECQGEICYRGRHVMMGYLANPEFGEEHMEEIRKKNDEAIDAEGWMHSGDMGAKTSSGVIKMTGRYKELIIGAGGENIAPVPIEDEIKRVSGGVISNVQVIGDQRKYNVAMITLSCKGASGEKPGSTELEDSVKQRFPGVSTIEEACKSAEFIKFMDDILAATNKNGLVCPSNAARIQKYTVLPLDFSVETEELTATLKLKRKVAEQKNIKTLEAMYESEAKETFFMHIG